MLLIFLYSLSFNVLLAASTENSQRSLNEHGTDRTFRGLSSSRMAQTNQNPIFNMTYIDKSENVVRVPNLKNIFDEHHNKRKTVKKSPKRTIQKIIKKTKSKRKLYLNQATSLPPKPSTNVNDLDKFYAQEEMLQRNESLSPQVNQHKKKKRWNSRKRYQMPFQNLAPKRDHSKRNKRSDDREDVFILTDLDEVEFLNKDKEDNVVKAHMKKYW